MLECTGLTVGYGHHRALESVALRIAREEIVVILGANGAGKTTLLKAIAGLVPVAESGRIVLDGQSVTHRPPHEIVEAGLALVPEGRGIFGDLTVRENLLLGGYARRARDASRENLERVLALFPRLAERSAQVARTMSGGEQQMVAIGRALMSAPKILMLDEPSLGLSPLLCSELFKALVEVRRTGVGILLVEQNARQGLAISDRAYLLENGHVVGEGAAQALARDPAVQRAYLGVGVGVPVPAVRPEEAVELARQAAVGFGDRSGTGVRAEALIPQSIEELVSRAAAIQADDVMQARSSRAPARSGAPGANAVAGVSSLDDALARIEAAAAQARRGGGASATRASDAGARAGGSGQPGESGDEELPRLEVYRAPRLEIYRRTADGGSLVRVNGD